MCDQGVGCGFFQKIGRFSVIFESQVKHWEKFDIELFKGSLQHYGLDDWIEYLERNGL